MIRRGNLFVHAREETSSTHRASHLRAGLSLSWPSHIHIQPNLLKSCQQRSCAWSFLRSCCFSWRQHCLVLLAVTAEDDDEDVSSRDLKEYATAGVCHSRLRNPSDMRHSFFNHDKISTSLVECERVKAKIGKALCADGSPHVWMKFPPARGQKGFLS